ncbi:hypothetical protein B9Z19DRAFT_1122555 [Tuber borchii]|uniref:Uncharacterized protein n=1 Tax=Tuber borchii TaxID=42251 RepID=A0A2T7A086_TUBBO|nr:hypothetical protein B9Z19DRAFT_1122555 [Tuber borchii]
MSAQSPKVKSAEGNSVEEERKSRIAGFESHARSMGIIGEEAIAQKVAIWEGIWAAKQSGNEFEYGAGILLDTATNADQ